MSEEREGLSSSGRKSNSDTPADPSSAALERAFDKFRGYIDSRLENLAVSLQTAPQAPVESIHSSTRKFQREAEAQKLKYKANSKQFLHNAEVEDHVVAITQYLEKEIPDAEQALETAKKALLVIQKRQKLIKLADKSEAGWLAVQEYESDELADGSDDEKRIKKAQEKGARKKRQLMQQQTKGKRPRYNSTACTSVRPEDRQLFREGTGALNVELATPTGKVEYAVDMEATPKRIGNTAQIPSTAPQAVENEVNDLSDDESVIL
ncbi:hypothetical protein QZH41_012158, partial [Actinostola sp. cb2023]